MSVGKDSILRAANAEAKTTEVKAEPAKTTEEAKAPAEVKEAVKVEAQVKEPEVKKAPAKKPRTTKAKTTTSKTAVKKNAPKKTTTRKKTVKTSVLTPEHSEVLEAAFVNSEWSGSYQRRTSGLSSVDHCKTKADSRQVSCLESAFVL